MQPFVLQQANNTDDAIERFGLGGGTIAYLCGGTSLVDQMKLDIARPEQLIDLAALRGEHAAITFGKHGLSIGAFATMSELGDHLDIAQQFPVVTQAIQQAASPQIRNMASIGGTLLQRTRCSSFRDRHSACNRRTPGAGCAAIGGDSRALAILGVSSSCIANYPGDLAVALVALDASVIVRGAGSVERLMRLEDLYRLPGNRPDVETTLASGELIFRIEVPSKTWGASTYVKIRDRASYAFALVSAAVAIDLDADSCVSGVRIALGGLAAKPWRCREAEQSLIGLRVNEETARRAGELGMVGARADAAQAFKVELGIRTIMRGLLDVAAIAHSREREPTNRGD